MAHAWGASEADADPGQAPLRLADAIRRHGLGLPAEVAAEAHRPLIFVYAQLAHMAAPVLDALIPGRRVARLASALEHPQGLEAVLARLRAPEGPDARGPVSEAPRRR